jgi:HD-GYP domain-containing protein (c-di-GMP phosphodiesterase class II)
LSTRDQATGDDNLQIAPTLLAIPVSSLRLGMYVHLNCSWFLHPFAHQQFKVSSDEVLRRLTTLDLPILVDPSRSDVAIDRAMGTDISSASTDAADSSASVAALPVAGPTAVREPKPQSLNEFLEGLREADRVCADACSNFRQAFEELSAGREDGVAEAKSVINQLVGFVSDEAMAVALSGLLDCRLMDIADLRHALSVSILSMMVGQQLEFPLEDLKVLGIGALLHDVGESKIPSEVLARRGALTWEDRAIYHRHPQYALEILQAIPSFPLEGLRIIEHHHERLDGTGYPKALASGDLSLLTQIVMVVDAYDELIRPRSPKQSSSPSEALAYLFRHTQHALSRTVVVALIQCLSVYPPGTIVRMVNGAYGMVLNVNRQDRLRPLVLLYQPAESEENPLIVDLMADQSRAIANRAVRQHMSSRVLNYLDFKRWVSYFLQNMPGSTARSAA